MGKITSRFSASTPDCTSSLTNLNYSLFKIPIKRAHERVYTCAHAHTQRTIEKRDAINQRYIDIQMHGSFIVSNINLSRGFSRGKKRGRTNYHSPLFCASTKVIFLSSFFFHRPSPWKRALTHAEGKNVRYL